MGVFAALYLSQDVGGKLFCSDPLKALLEGALDQQVACQLWLHFQDRKKAAGAKIGELEGLGLSFYLFIPGKHEKGVGGGDDLGNHQADFFISTASSVMIV